MKPAGLQEGPARDRAPPWLYLGRGEARWRRKRALILHQSGLALKLPSLLPVTKANRIRIRAFSLEHVAHPATQSAVHYKFRVWASLVIILGRTR